jgi:polyisoprenyl-phosphate glycosyltransferase
VKPYSGIANALARNHCKKGFAMRMLSIVTPCYNEEGNVQALYEKVCDVIATLPNYTHEHIFIDNCSKDKTVEILREMARKDKRVKVIVNSRNYGHIRSPTHGLLQATGDAVISLVADFQDPPDMILQFVKKWEEGYKVVIGVKANSEESPLMFFIRKCYYDLINRLSDVELVKNYTGFGLYDRTVMDVIRKIEDPYPYFRGMISDVGFESFKIPYTQPSRRRGITKNNFYTLYDMAMLGITNHSKIPLRLATLLGFFMSALSLLLALLYLIAKLAYWNEFDIGTAPLLIGVFLFSSVQLFFIGVIGEYIGAIHTQVLKRPLVVEKERINF